MVQLKLWHGNRIAAMIAVMGGRGEAMTIKPTAIGRAAEAIRAVACWERWLDR
jgi:hypothetical protein